MKFISYYLFFSMIGMCTHLFGMSFQEQEDLLDNKVREAIEQQDIGKLRSAIAQGAIIDKWPCLMHPFYHVPTPPTTEHQAIEFYTEVTSLLKDRQKNLLRTAIQKRDIRKLRSAIVQGAVVDQYESIGRPANILFQVAPIIEATEQGFEAGVELLITQGAHASCQNHNGETPVFIAAKQGNINLLTMLLEHNANPCTRDINGRSPIDAACLLRQQNKGEVISILKFYTDLWNEKEKRERMFNSEREARHKLISQFLD